MAPIIDGVLKDWGDRLFPEEVHGRRPANLRGGKGGGGRPAPRALRARLARTVHKAPEVLVKISGGGRNAGGVRAHLDYISRHGKLELEDEQGSLAKGRDENEEVLKGWMRSYGGIPETGEHARQTFNVVLSMPPGTSRAGVKEAARAFAAAQFGGNHSYVFVEHTDEKHPHVHLVVKARGRDGKRLNPRKADLQQWRERFAEALHAQGIVANATPRRARGARQQSTRKDVYRGRERSGQSARGRKIAPKLSPEVAQAYRQVLEALGTSTDAEDRALARQVASFVAETTEASKEKAPGQTPEKSPAPKTNRGPERE